MSNLVPFVAPANNEVGVSIESSITAIFEKAMEEGSITSSSCFIVEIPTHDLNGLDNYLSNSSIGDIVSSKVFTKRLSLNDDTEYLLPDYGDNINSGLLYRTNILIKPNSPLKPNTTYAALLSKDISTISVFDAKKETGSGTGSISTKGLYTGVIDDIYTITIGLSGNENTAKYIWTRMSDNYSSTLKNARSRFLEITDGVFIRFEEGTYAIGDTFTIKVKPEDKQENIFGWTFSTGSGKYENPSDENSDNLIGLPVENQEMTPSESFYVTSIEPEYGQTCLAIPKKGVAYLGNLIFRTLEYTDTYNGYLFRLTSGGTAGNENVAIDTLSKVVTIQIEENVSTSEQITNAFNNSSLVNNIFTASFIGESSSLSILPDALMTDGYKNIPIIITFNKEIDPSSIDSKIKIITSQIYPAQSSKKVFFSYTVSGKVLIITLKE